mmetsp:Transcript_3651/g.5618  ORF Transcript_3651/g.5618 Transcript_3651/m.5618 type:complete len:98 (-) Transcript_3651:568-861(-)
MGMMISVVDFSNTTHYREFFFFFRLDRVILLVAFESWWVRGDESGNTAASDKAYCDANKYQCKPCPRLAIGMHQYTNSAKTSTCEKHPVAILAQDLS